MKIKKLSLFVLYIAFNINSMSTYSIQGVYEQAIENRQFKIASEIIKTNKIIINPRRSEDGSSLLHIAVSAGDHELIRFLLKHLNGKKSDINAQNLSGETALHTAARNGAAEIALILLEGGANVDAQNFKHNTPLHIAAYYDDINMAENLLKHDASIKIENCDKKTPMQIAIAKETEMRNLLARYKDNSRSNPTKTNPCLIQ